MVITAVAAGGVYATRAYFTDTEKSTGNTFSTGTVDIAVDGENPWSETGKYSLIDMKPSYTDYIEFVVHNVGGNPVNLYKTLKNFEGSEIDDPNEPECEAENGTWENGVCSGNHAPVNNLQAKINYDLRVELYSQNPDEGDVKPVWWETIYMDEDNRRLNTLGQMYLGMIPEDWYMKVIQSYHMPKGVGNEYQSDMLTFDIELYAEQLTNTITLENKYEPDTELSHHIHDEIYGTLSHNVRGSTFDYDLVAQGLQESTDYSLIYYADPWAGEHPGALIGTHTTDGDGKINDLGQTVELNMDLPTSPDANYPGGAKIWLVPSNDYDESGKKMSAWNPSDYLFETGLIRYDDTDL